MLKVSNEIEISRVLGAFCTAVKRCEMNDIPVHKGELFRIVHIDSTSLDVEVCNSGLRRRGLTLNYEGNERLRLSYKNEAFATKFIIIVRGSRI